MKVGVMILNAMFLLLFISTVIGEWGKAPAIIAGIAIVSVVINSVFILIRTKSDFEG
jgi:predicted membrane protein